MFPDSEPAPPPAPAALSQAGSACVCSLQGGGGKKWAFTSNTPRSTKTPGMLPYDQVGEHTLLSKMEISSRNIQCEIYLGLFRTDRYNPRIWGVFLNQWASNCKTLPLYSTGIYIQQVQFKNRHNSVNFIQHPYLC